MLCHIAAEVWVLILSTTVAAQDESIAKIAMTAVMNGDRRRVGGRKVRIRHRV